MLYIAHCQDIFRIKCIKCIRFLTIHEIQIIKLAKKYLLPMIPIHTLIIP